MAQGGQASFDRLFELLRETPETTRTDLVRRSGLSKATVSETIAELMSHGFLSEIGKRQPGRGRSQVVLAFEPGTRLVIGAQFTEHGCHAALCDLRAGPLAFAERPLNGNDPQHFVDSMVECVEELLPQAEAPVLGMGVGVPGLVDPSGRNVVISVPHGWKDVPICDMLEARLGLPVVVANRAKAAALGEYWQGVFPDEADRSQLVYVFVGSGIVSGFVFDGQLHMGHSGSAGELGHITVLPDGPQCGCGNHGCLYMLSSESAIIRSVRGRLRQVAQSPLHDALPGQSLGALSLDMLLDAAVRGDEVVLGAVREAGTYLAIAIANVINLMNPSLVVVGGPVAEFGDPLIEAIMQEVRQRALWDALHGLTIVPSALGDTAGTVGAAAIFLDTLNVADMIAAAPVL